MVPRTKHDRWARGSSPLEKSTERTLSDDNAAAQLTLRCKATLVSSTTVTSVYGALLIKGDFAAIEET